MTHRLHAQVARYIAAGLANTAVTYMLLVLGMRWLHYALAYTLVYAVGIVLAYWLQTRFVFRVPLHWRTALRFPLVYAVQYVLGLALLTVLVEIAGLPQRWAALVAIAANVPAGFVLSRLLLARDPCGRTDALGGPPPRSAP
jgi:putative flippase GtrA